MRWSAVVLAVGACLAAAGITSSVAAAGPYETRTSTGEVAFEVTPRNEPLDGRFTIDIRAKTETGSLADLDLASIVSLEAGETTLRPVFATKLSGRHSAGWVTFEIKEIPDQFAVTMTGVRKMAPLRFEWP